MSCRRACPRWGPFYLLSEAAKARLRASGLAALPNQDVERLSNAYMRFFPEDQISVFITPDVALHLFHIVFDDLLAEVEKGLEIRGDIGYVTVQRKLHIYPLFLPLVQKNYDAARQ